MKPLQVTAAIIRKGDTILAAQRDHKDELGMKWELPGGKIEPGETAEECIIRELHEEFGIYSKVMGYLGENTHDYGNKVVCLKAFFVEHLSGEFQTKVHQKIRWVKIYDLGTIDWVPADINLIKMFLKHYNSNN